MVAKTFFGFEDILEKELHTLGAMNVKKAYEVSLSLAIKALCTRPTYPYAQP